MANFAILTFDDNDGSLHETWFRPPGAQTQEQVAFREDGHIDFGDTRRAGGTLQDAIAELMTDAPRAVTMLMRMRGHARVGVTYPEGASEYDLRALREVIEGAGGTVTQMIARPL